ncbi:MAG: hypothetical protein U5K77_01265 [Candidatus Saccharibacteria bacterium]|nr:hypothetical protein [Candidatus Saccharibacteria bacterium]
MKQKDIALVIIIIFITGIFSFILSNLLISTPENRQQEVEVVHPIVSEFPTPDERFFNEDSINPTQEIRIGTDDPNTSPFDDSEQ